MRSPPSSEFTSQLDRESPQYQQWYDFQWGSASQQSLQYSDNLADTVYGHGGYRVFTPPTKVNDVFSRIIRLSGVEGDCLVWHGTSNGRYGRLHVGDKLRYVHRLMYEIIYGDFTGYLTHTCGNSLCCRPEHLRIKRDRRQAEAEGKASGVEAEEPSGEALSL
jgi:hypothetical protein